MTWRAGFVGLAYTTTLPNHLRRRSHTDDFKFTGSSWMWSDPRSVGPGRTAVGTVLTLAAALWINRRTRIAFR